MATDHLADGDEADLGAPLDPRQVERIGAVHGGFLYQHLYTVACLLTLGRQPGARVIVERDEDSECLTPETRVYSQVKVRSRPLQPADVAEALERFAALRAEHANGERHGAASFQIVTNAKLGPALEAASARSDWPVDVRLVTPGVDPAPMPPSWSDIDEALVWCAQKAEDIPFGALSTQTLVWKLAALVQHASTGARERTFRAEDLPGLLEQLLVQLQDFPDPPLLYRPQVDEPPLTADQPVRLLTGFSGAGKTAWASQAALHSPAMLVYFDVTDMPSGSMAASLAREITVRFLGGRSAGAAGVLAQSSGLDALRACARRLADDGVSVQVVLDNAHRIEATALQNLVSAAPGVRFLCIGQPWPGAALVEAAFGIVAESLSGWSQDDIAAEFAAEGAPATVRQTETLRRLTGGFPLYVRSAAQLTARTYGGDVEAFCTAIEARTHDVETAQDLILEANFTGLDKTTRRAAAVLGLSETPLSRDEALKLLELAGLGQVEGARAIRNLRRSSIAIGFQGDRLGLHDAVRGLAVDHGDLSDTERHDLQAALALLLRLSLQKTRDVVRLSSLLRLMARIGQVDVLVDLAGDEMFYEQGDPGALRREIEAAADDPSKTPSDRFWAQDSLAYWESRDGGQPDRQRLKDMEDLIALGDLGPRERMALAFKELAYWGTEGNLAQIERAYRSGAALKCDAETNRLLRYNHAFALNRARQLGKAKTILERLISDYHAALGITEAQVRGRNGAAFLALLTTPIDYEACKRLADCLNLWSIIVVHLGMFPGLRRIAAMKFYSAGQAARSAVSTGQELADDFLDMIGDARGAAEVLEDKVIPMMLEARLTDMIVPVRSQYAVVLAFAGRIDEARREITALAEYAGEPEQVQTIRERARVIEDVASGRRRAVPKAPGKVAGPRFIPNQRPPPKVGRNAQCPCGSGEKFKRCCS